MTDENRPPSPGSSDEQMTQMMTFGMDKENSSDQSLNKSPGRQGEQNTGGKNVNIRVLWLSNIVTSVDYQTLYEYLKPYGKIERMKLKLSSDRMSFDCYTTFEESVPANKAHVELNGQDLGGFTVRTKLFEIGNVSEDVYDFIPREAKAINSGKAVRNPPTLTWYVATLKESNHNMMRATEYIESKVGNIPEGNLKRYGKNILIKAGNEVQAMLLKNFKAPPNGYIEAVTPHKTFNTLKGVLYSKDLYEFEEEEILERCPPCVYQVRKLKGMNSAILLTFTSSYIPDTIRINHVNMKVKKFSQYPKQCHHCFEYGHIAKFCTNKKRCYICSTEHDEWNGCDLDKFCFHCKGNHSPNYKHCPRHKFEQEILEVANNEYISVGSAKWKVMGANRHPDSSYAAIVKQMKPQNTRHQHSTTSHRMKVNRIHEVPPKETPNQSQSHNKQLRLPRPSTQRVPHHTSMPNLAGGSPVSPPPATTEVCERVIAKPKPQQLESNSASAEMDSESLPDLTAPKEISCPQPSHSVHPSDKKSVGVELKSSVTTVAKKSEIKKDGFSTPSAKKRTRPASPKNKDYVIETSNSFSVLEITPMAKKQAVSKELKGEKSTLSPKAYQYVEQACRPKVHRSGIYNSKENQSASEAMKKEPLKKTDNAIPSHSSSQKVAANGSKQNRPLNNTTYNTKSGTPQPHKC